MSCEFTTLPAARIRYLYLLSLNLSGPDSVIHGIAPLTRSIPERFGQCKK